MDSNMNHDVTDALANTYRVLSPGSSPETHGGGAFRPNALSTTGNEHIRVLLAYLPTKRASRITSDRQSLTTVGRRQKNNTVARDVTLTAAAAM